MEEVRVDQVLVGYCDEDPKRKGWCNASCSVTLVRDPTSNTSILVDTASPWDGAKLIKELEDGGASPETITHVVCTHGHSDHVGNLNLFRNASFIMAEDFSSPPDSHTELKGRERLIGEDVYVIRTPGHTAHDLSLVVKRVQGFGTIVVAGDTFECKNDRVDEGLWRGSSWKEGLQAESRATILAMADYIIPGHGPMFPVHG